VNFFLHGSGFRIRIHKVIESGSNMDPDPQPCTQVIEHITSSKFGPKYATRTGAYFFSRLFRTGTVVNLSPISHHQVLCVQLQFLNNYRLPKTSLIISWSNNLVFLHISNNKIGKKLPVIYLLDHDLFNVCKSVYRAGRISGKNSIRCIPSLKSWY
jgi:hypothetical protein